MTFFKKRRTIRRCKTLASYVGGIDDELVQRMADYLLQDPRNTVQATREYLMFVSAAGTIAASKPITPLRDDFVAIAISSSWARVRNPYGQTSDNGSVGTTMYDTDHTYPFDQDRNDHDGDDESGWDSFSDSDGSSFTNNNNNNNNNNG